MKLIQKIRLTTTLCTLKPEFNHAIKAAWRLSCRRCENSLAVDSAWLKEIKGDLRRCIPSLIYFHHIYMSFPSVMIGLGSSHFLPPQYINNVLWFCGFLLEATLPGFFCFERCIWMMRCFMGIINLISFSSAAFSFFFNFTGINICRILL